MATDLNLHAHSSGLSASGLGPCRGCGVNTYGGICQECWFNKRLEDNGYDPIGAMLKRLCEEQNWRCCYCGHDWRILINRKTRPTVEHIIPRSKGGTDEWVNLAAACSRCNSHRGTFPIDENWTKEEFTRFMKDRGIIRGFFTYARYSAP